MSSLKMSVVFFVVLLSQICWSQTTGDLMPYLQDFKSVSANNTVTVTSYEKDGSHYVYAGGFGGIDIFSLDTGGKLTSIGAKALYKKEGLQEEWSLIILMEQTFFL